MIPVRPVFQRMARLARDLARKMGKGVELVVSGEETELDKSMVDRLGDPLVHLIRNAMDHGLEPPADRRRAGKPETGRVELRAFQKGGSIHVEVEDDGRGLDRDAILAKARERGLLAPGETPGDREAFRFVFEPGFSTAAVVTDVSGRGVGLDVVKRQVEAMHGQVDIRTERGRGATVALRLPLTLAIIDGMVVRVGGERFILPALSVVSAIRPSMDEVRTVLGLGEILARGEQILPLFRLGRLYDAADAIQDLARAIAVIVEDEGRQVALLVDELVGMQQIVIKPLDGTLRGATGLSGGAIMPDGQVGLIVDIGGVVRLAHARRDPAQAAAVTAPATS